MYSQTTTNISCLQHFLTNYLEKNKFLKLVDANSTFVDVKSITQLGVGIFCQCEIIELERLLKLQILHLLQARSSLTFRQLWSVDSLWNTYMTWQEHTAKCTVQISTQNTAQSFGQFGQMVECSFKN